MSIARWIPEAPPSTSGFRRSEMWLLPSGFSSSFEEAWHPRPRVIDVDGNPRVVKIFT
jgi:hypothetical protein